MVDSKIKISANDAIIRMIKAVNLNDMPSFYKIIDEYANSFVYTSSTRQTILGLARQKPMQLMKLESLSSNIKNLIIQSEGNNENVFLNDPISLLIEELLIEWGNIPLYAYHNLKVRNKILLHGTTGNGKTTIARYIAKKANLPYVEIKSDEVIDSHLGSTGSNIYNIFNSIKEPCVLFWDEIDSIGCKRGKDVHAAGHENDRMTNSLLVNIEKLSSEVVFIAATNRKEVLDSAFERRFDVKFEVLAPIDIEKEIFAAQLISYYKLPIEIPSLSTLNSYAEIKNEIVSLARNYVINIIINPVEATLN